jgi:type I restriction enzyme S subunit
MKIELKTQQQEEYKETELGPLPVEWSVVRIGDVFDVKQGKQLSSKESKEGKSLKPFLRTSNVLWGKINIANIDQMPFSTEEFNKLILKHGDVLVCEGGAIGRTALWNAPITECVYQNHLHRLRVKEEGSTFPHFFVFWMEYAISQRRLYINDANVTTIPNLSQSRLKNFDILHPPLPEQHRIATMLSAVQDAKEKTEVVIAAAKSLKKSLMRHLFTYGPVSAGAAESVPLKETEIGRVPEGWGVVQLQDQINIIDCKHITPKYVRLGIPLIRPRNIKDGEIDYSDIEYISEEQYKFFTEKHAPEQGDILFSRNASYGNPAYVKTKQKLCIGQDMVVMTHRCANTLYIFYLLCSNLLLAQINLLSTGSTIHRINLKDIRRLLIPLPPLPTQQKIASLLSTIDRKIEAEENKKIALDELFKSLLHNLMTGKVRVNHLEMMQ